jgi:hypothetical protein
MAPGIIGVSGGRPRPQGNMVHFACLVSKQHVRPKLVVGHSNAMEVPFAENMRAHGETLTSSKPTPVYGNFTAVSYRPLVDFCVCRSGDKGDSSNIGVLVRDPSYFPWICSILTEVVGICTNGAVLNSFKALLF